MKPTKKTAVAAICRSCNRVLRRSNQDTDRAAAERAKWSNIRETPEGLAACCRSCKKKGRT